MIKIKFTRLQPIDYVNGYIDPWGDDLTAEEMDDLLSSASKIDLTPAAGWGDYNCVATVDGVHYLAQAVEDLLS